MDRSGEARYYLLGKSIAVSAVASVAALAATLAAGAAALTAATLAADAAAQPTVAAYPTTETAVATI